MSSRSIFERDFVAHCTNRHSAARVACEQRSVLEQLFLSLCARCRQWRSCGCCNLFRRGQASYTFLVTFLLRAPSLRFEALFALLLKLRGTCSIAVSLPSKSLLVLFSGFGGSYSRLLLPLRFESPLTLFSGLVGTCIRMIDAVLFSSLLLRLWC